MQRNKLKDFVANILKRASERIRKEKIADLQKESASDIFEEIMALFRLKNEKFSSEFQKAANVLKALISKEILEKKPQEEISRKAEAVKILENIFSSSIEDKRKTGDTLKIIVFKMMREHTGENNNIQQILARAFDLIRDLTDQEVEKNNALDRLTQADKTNENELNSTFKSLIEAKNNINSAIKLIDIERSQGLKASEEMRANSSVIPKIRNLRRRD